MFYEILSYKYKLLLTEKLVLVKKVNFYEINNV